MPPIAKGTNAGHHIIRSTRVQNIRGRQAIHPAATKCHTFSLLTFLSKRR
jgi:hypothetical protein